MRFTLRLVAKAAATEVSDVVFQSPDALERRIIINREFGTGDDHERYRSQVQSSEMG